MAPKQSKASSHEFPESCYHGCGCALRFYSLRTPLFVQVHFYVLGNFLGYVPQVFRDLFDLNRGAVVECDL